MRRLKKCLASLVAVCLLLSLAVLPASGAAADYPDLPPEGAWSHDALAAAVENGLLRGTDGKLLPDGALTRAQMAAVINRAFGAWERADLSAYTDVSAGGWYRDDMALAVGMRTLSGDGAGKLSPGAEATREAVFTVLARAMRLGDGDGAALEDFADAGQVSPWARGPVAAMVAGGYVKGAGGRLNPQGGMTRAEFAQVLYNLLGGYIGGAGVYTEVPAGNVMVNAPGVTLKGVTVAGDLIVGDGVADGELVLDGVTVQGRLVVRGGGEHSIRIVNKSSVGSVVVGKTSSGGVRVMAERGCRVELIQVDDGRDDIILEGEFNAVAVESDAPVVLRDAVVSELAVNAPGAAVSLEGKTAVTTARVDEQAQGAALSVAKDAVVAKVESAAPQAAITGEGKVTEALVSGSGTKVDTAGTTLTVDKDATGVTAGDKEVAGGTTTTVTPPKEESKPSGGGSSGPVYSTRTVTTADAFLSAVGDPYCTGIVVSGNITLDGGDVLELNKSLTINAGSTLTIDRMVVLDGGAVLTNNGTLKVDQYTGLGTEAPGSAMTLVNKGTIQIGKWGEIEVYPSCAVTEVGTINKADAVVAENAPGGRLTGMDIYPAEGAAQTAPAALDGAYNSRSAMSKSMAGIRAAVAAESGSKYAYYYLYGEDAVLELDGDFTIPDNARLSVTHGVTLKIGEGKTLTIVNTAVLRIEGTVEILSGGTLTNNGAYHLASVGKLVNNGTLNGEGGTHTAAYRVTTQEEWNTAVTDIQNCTYIGVDVGNGSIAVNDSVIVPQMVVESGTLTVKNGAALTLTDWDEIQEGATLTVESGGTLTFAEAGYGLKVFGTLNNGGTFTANGFVGVWGEEAVLTNTGALTVSGELEVSGGTLNNSGTLTIAENADVNVNDGGTLNNSGTITKTGNLNLRNATLSGTAVDNINVTDVYDGVARTPSAFPAETTFGEGGGYGAEIWNEAGLRSAMASDKPYHGCWIGQAWDENGPQTAEITVNTPLTITKNLDVGYRCTLVVKSNLTVEDHLNVGPGGVVKIESGANLMVSGQDSGFDVSGAGENEEYQEAFGTLTSGGTITLGDNEHNSYADIRGTLTLTGGSIKIAQQSNLNVNGGTLTLGDTAKFTNNGGFTLERGAKLIKENNATIHNANYMQVVDEYGLDGGNKAVTLPRGGFFTNDSNWYEHNAYVYSGDGLKTAFESATAYDFYHIRASMELTENLTLAGKQVRIDCDDEGHPVTLTIPSEKTLTVSSGTYTPHGGDAYIRGGLLEVNGGSTLTVAGTLTFGGQDDTVIVWEGATLDGEGTITAHNENATPIRARDMMDGEGAVETEATVADKFSTIVRREALATSGADFSAANGEDSYKAIVILNDMTCDLGDLSEKTEFTLNKDVEIYWGGKLVIPEGMTFTISQDCSFYLAGDLWVNGALVNEGHFNQADEGQISGSGTCTNSGGTVEGVDPGGWTERSE